MSDDAPRNAPSRRPRRAARAPGRPNAVRPAAADGLIWLFGLHAVREALENPRRDRRRLIVTANAALKLEAAIAASGMTAETADPRRFPAPLDPGSVHQGAALAAAPLEWGEVETACAPGADDPAPRVLLLDRVSDPHNVGAILRSAEAFGARAVIAPRRHAAPETGALAKAASGALERQPYLRVANLARAIEALKDLGYAVIGLDGEAELDIEAACIEAAGRPTALALGAEGAGLRALTRELCDRIARVPTAADFASLNVSNAAALALYEASRAARSGRS